jgi:hypothetical protein
MRSVWVNKKTIICLLGWITAVGFSDVSAQNLQYGKSKLISSKTDTVPAGKVWKVESFMYAKAIENCPSTTTPINITDSVVLNGNKMPVRAQRFVGTIVSYYVNATAASSPEFIIWEQKTPMWLPAGTTLAAGTGVLYINVLEFKEAP